MKKILTKLLVSPFRNLSREFLNHQPSFITTKQDIKEPVFLWQQGVTDVHTEVENHYSDIQIIFSEKESQVLTVSDLILEQKLSKCMKNTILRLCLLKVLMISSLSD